MKRPLSPIVALVILLALAACSSRYRLNLYEVYGEEAVRSKVERTQFIAGAVLASPLEREKFTLGDGSLVILHTGSRGPSTSASSDRQLLSYDRYQRYELYLQLPSRLSVTSVSLTNSAILQMMGSYERSPEERVFYPIAGTLAIDSLPKEHLFGTVDATFQNAVGEQVGFRGQFKVRIED